MTENIAFVLHLAAIILTVLCELFQKFLNAMEKMISINCDPEL